MTDEYTATALRHAWDRLVALTKEAEKNGFNVRINNNDEYYKLGGGPHVYRSPSNEHLKLTITKTVQY